MTATARDRDEAVALPSVARLPEDRAGAAALALEARAPATRRAYRAALERLDATLAGRPLSDATLAEHVFRLAADGLAPASIAQAAAAAAFLARVAGWANPRGAMTADALRIVKRSHAERGRGQARPVGAEDVAAIIATARREGRDKDAAIAGVLFQAALRRSEAAALEWRDIEPAADIAGALRIRVRRSKTDRAGEETDIRLVKNGAADALAAIRLVNAVRSPGQGVRRPQRSVHRPPLCRRCPRRRHRGRERPFRPRRPRLRANRAWRVYDRGHALRRLEDRPHGRPLQRRREGRTRRRRKVPLRPCGPGHAGLPFVDGGVW